MAYEDLFEKLLKAETEDTVTAALAEHGFDELDAPIRRLNGLHSPTPYSPPLENAVVPGVDEITAAIKNLHEE